MTKTNRTILLDCTLRDGGYYNHWDFSPDLIADYLLAMSAISADFIEIGFRSLDHRGFKGGAAYSSDAWIRSLTIPAGLKIGVMVNAAELLDDSQGPIPALQKLFAPAAASPVSLVRLACHPHEVAAVQAACEWLKQQGYLVGLNLMQITELSLAEVAAIGRQCVTHAIDVLYFADSLGSLSPEQTAAIVRALRKYWQGSLGIHTHDSMAQALANSMRAQTEGVTWIDCTVTGMGRGPGNVRTEYLVLAAEDQRGIRADLTSLLSLIRKHFSPLQTIYGWGSNPYYYLAGKYGIHPTYIQEMLSDSRYTDADILAVIEHFRVTGGKRYSASSLESARHFYSGEARGTWRPESVMSGREVLILGAGPGLTSHKAAIETYIRQSHPYVIALNTQISVASELIDVRAACHPIRLLADCEQHARLPQPLMTPASMLPESVVQALIGKPLLDYGLGVAERTFRFAADHSVLPTSLVVAYAMAAATSGKASRILLAGFDSYGSDDPRTDEMDNLLQDYQLADGALPLLSITPTRYKIASSSVYALI